MVGRSEFRSSVDDVHDFYISHAINEIYKSYGKKVSVNDKGKTLRKFGRNPALGADTLSTVGTFQGSLANETFATGNTIDYVISDDAADAGKQVTIEGHTVDTTTGDMSFVVQNVTLGNQTAVALTTPMFRANRLFGSGGTYTSPQGALAGNIAVYDSSAAGGLTSFLPTTATATKLFLTAGQQQSAKAATSISASDFYIVTSVRLNIDRSSASAVTAYGDLYHRQLGNEFRPSGLELQCRTNGNATDHIADPPYTIVPYNSDVRLMVESSTGTTISSGHMAGYLAKIID